MNYPITVSNGNKVVGVSGNEYKVKLVIERDGHKFYYTVYNNQFLLTVERLSKYLNMPSSSGGVDHASLVGVVNHVRTLLGAATEEEFLEIEEITLDAEPLALGGWYEIKGGNMTVKAGGESWTVKVDDMIVSDTAMLLRKLREKVSVMLLMASAIRGDFAAGNDYHLAFSQGAKDKVIAALKPCKEAETVAVYIDSVAIDERSFTASGIESCEVRVTYRRTENTPVFTTEVGDTPFSDLLVFKNAVRDRLCDLTGDAVIFTADGDKLLSDAYYGLGLGLDK